MNHDMRDQSLDDHDILKGDIKIGAIAGEDAQQAAADEHNLTFGQALRLYPKAIAWSMFFSMGIIMTAFGDGSLAYDLCLTTC